MTKWQKACIFASVAALVLIFLRLESAYGWIEWTVGEAGDWYARQTGAQGPIVPPYEP